MPAAAAPLGIQRSGGSLSRDVLIVVVVGVIVCVAIVVAVALVIAIASVVVVVSLIMTMLEAMGIVTMIAIVVLVLFFFFFFFFVVVFFFFFFFFVAPFGSGGRTGYAVWTSRKRPVLGVPRTGPKTAQIGPGPSGTQNGSDLIGLLRATHKGFGGLPNRRICPPETHLPGTSGTGPRGPPRTPSGD